MGRLYPYLLSLFGFVFAVLVIGPLGSLVYDRLYNKDYALKFLGVMLVNWPWVILATALVGGLTFWSWLDSRDKSAGAGGPTDIAAVSQLPAPPADFTGRSSELTELVAQCRNGGIKGLILQGMGGIGKTALALKLAEQLTPCYPGAQLYLDMKGTSSSPLSVPEVFGHVVHAFRPEAQLPPAGAELAGLYFSTLHVHPALILLDNVQDDTQVTPLLPPSGCFLLATSRQYFVVPGMAVMRIGALPLKDACALILL